MSAETEVDFMAESDLIRGNVDTVILKVLYEGDRYGYDLIRQINARSDGQWEIKQPTVYACLKRLEKQGFISSYWDSNESDGGRRKYYTLTESGKEVFLKYKNEFERASALFGGLISGKDTMLMPDDYSDVEDETYTVSKRPRPKKPKQNRPAEPVAERPEETPEPEAASEDPAPDDGEKSEGVVFLDEDESNKSDKESSDDEYIRDLLELAESLAQSEGEAQARLAEETARREAEERRAAEEAERREEELKAARDAQNRATSDNEPLDPRRIIESYYRAEGGESYSDMRARSVYNPEQRQQTPPPPPPAAVPAPVQPTPPAKPTSHEITPAPAPQPIVSNIGFPDPDESRARKEYKTVLSDLVERLEIASPAVRDEQAEAPAVTEQAAAVAAETDEDRQFVKIKNTARDLGNDVQVTAHNNSAKQYAQKYYYYSNRLLMTHYTIMCIAMFLVGLTLFLTFYTGLNLRMEYDYLLYMAAGLLPIIMFIVTVIRYAGEPDKRKRVNLHVGMSVFIRCIIMIQVAVVTYCVNLIWGMPVAFSYNYLPSLIIPIAYALFIPISKIIFSALLKSGHYAVE